MNRKTDSNLICTCRRDQCRWSRLGNNKVSSVFCSKQNQCPDPADFFPNKSEDTNLQMVCYDKYGEKVTEDSVLLKDTIGKRQSWKDDNPVMDNSFNLTALFLMSPDVAKLHVNNLQKEAEFVDGVTCQWSCKNNHLVRPKK